MRPCPARILKSVCTNPVEIPSPESPPSNVIYFTFDPENIGGLLGNNPMAGLLWLGLSTGSAPRFGAFVLRTPGRMQLGPIYGVFGLRLIG
jgi:hypothetical protein